MMALADRYEPSKLNRIEFRLYQRFRPEVRAGSEGWAPKAVPDADNILAAR